MWAALFGATNLIAIAGWLVLLFAPRRERTFDAVLYGAVGLLCLAYLAMFVALFGDLVDPGRAVGAATADMSDYSIEGIRALFQSDGGIVVGWTHYLAFDLFTGLWIVRDGASRNASRLVQLPVLFATFLAGPIGLAAWLLLRKRRS